jgi:hypothetical protein
MKLHLITKAEYDTLKPYTQGYAVYWEGSQPASELRGLANPYDDGTAAHAEWLRGYNAAALDAQEGDDDA